MYKTVRHGENSLQYTILPQTEEVLNNSGVKGKGRNYSPTNKPTKNGHTRKEIFVNYFLVCLLALFLLSGLVFSLLAFIGVIPIDALNSNKSCHDTWTGQASKFTAKDLSAHTNLTEKKDSGIQNQTINPISSTQPPNLITSMSSASSESDVININTKTTDIDKPSESSTETTKWDQITPTKVKDVLPSGTIYPLDMTDYTKILTPTASVEKTSYYPLHQRKSNNDLMLNHETWSDYDDEDDDEDYDFTKLPTTTSYKTNEPDSLLIDSIVINTVSQISSTLPPVTTILANLNSSANQSSDIMDKTIDKTKIKGTVDTIKFKETKERILDDDDDDDEYKEPLTDEDDVSEQTKGDDVKIKAQTKSWLQIRWPFVDPSSYFQWTGYSARDNLLLPAILSAALSALLVLAVLCYALHRRQKCKRRIQEIGNLTSELQAEDNANLLAAEHSSEDE